MKMSSIVRVVLLAGLIGRPGEGQQAGDAYRDTIPGTEVEFVMTFAPAGTFELGSPDTEPGRDADEGPRRTVTLDAFWIGVHEVTHDEFAVFRFRELDDSVTAVQGEVFDADAVSRPSPPYEDPVHGMGLGDHPAAGMTQWAALQYARWLSEKTGRLYRLPTEAEWEYACRAGGRAGPLPEDSLVTYAWFIANSGERFHPVGEKVPNDWGVYDMLGNVAEWTMDQYAADWYATLEDGAHDPWARPDRTHPRTVRGGAFDDEATQLRCSDRVQSTLRWKRRDPQLPKSRWWNTDSPHVGFRLVSPARPMSMEAIRAYWRQLLES